MTDSILERLEAERWEVRVSRLGAGYHVRPCQGMGTMDNWSLTLNPRRSTSFWRCITGIYIRRQWPKTEKALAKAIADCEEWCRRRNEAEDTARAVVRNVGRVDARAERDG